MPDISFTLDVLPYITRTMRKAQSLTQTDLAKRAGVSKSMIYYVESGRPNISLDTLSRILRALDLELRIESSSK